MRSPDTRILRLSVNTRASLAATIVGTLGVNGLLAATDRLPTVTVCEPQTSTETTQITVPIPMKYARRYAQDAAAPVVAQPEQISTMVDNYLKLQRDGWRVDRIVNQGRASSDNTSTGPDGQPTGNFQDTSERNLELARAREQSAAPQIAAAFREHDIQPPPMESAPPVEDKLTAGPDGELAQMDRLALMYGYPSSTAMQNIFDRIIPGTVHPETVNFLNTHFRDERRVDSTLHASREVLTVACTEVPAGIPVPIPVFDVIAAPVFAPTTGPNPNVPNYAPVETRVDPIGHGKKPIKLFEPHPQGQGPKQIKAHHSRTHGGNRGMPRNFPNKKRA